MKIELDNQEFSVQVKDCFIQVSTKNDEESTDYFFILFGGAPTFIGYLKRFSKSLALLETKASSIALAGARHLAIRVYEDLNKPLDINSIVEYANKGLSFPEEYGYYNNQIKKELMESLLLVLLIHKLSELENSSMPYSQYLTKDSYPEFNLLYYLADEVLINKGRVNSDNKEKLKDKGFMVTPGEKDSFGWLSGLIHTKKGRIVFG